MIPGSATSLLLSNQDTGYKIDRSLRFNSGDSSKISRTPSSASNRKTWTMSYWVKRAKLSTEQMVFSAASSSSDRVHFYYESTDNIAVYSPSFYYTTNVIARDPGAWQHLVFACDTTQSTDTDRFKIYVNSVLVTSFVNQSHPSQNLDTPVSNNILHQFSGRGYNSSNHADVYLAEINFVDGQQLAPTDFGEYDNNNVWQPKEFTGSYTTSGVSFDFLEQEIYASGTREALFDGSTSTYMSVRKTTASSSSTAPSNTKRIKITFPTPKTGVTKLRVYGGGNTSSTNKVWYNEDESTMITNNDPVGWKTVYTGSAITINSISVGTSDGGCNLRAIEINDVVLTDAIEQGINSFHLPFSDNSSAAALGTDSSGNNNDWTVNNLSIASGAGNDSLLDTPTNYDDGTNVGGNYATWNPIATIRSTNGGVAGTGSYSNGNLVSTGQQKWSFGLSTIAIPGSGKWYCEMEPQGNNYAGIASFVDTLDGTIRDSSTSNGTWYGFNSTVFSRYSGQGSTASEASSLAPWSSGILGVAVDADNGVVTFYVNGSLQYAYTLSSQIASILYAGKMHFMADCYYSSSSVTANFGQRPFAYTPPTGYKSLCTTNLPDPTIADGSLYFDTKVWSGSSSSQSITYPFTPDFAWVKSRNQGYHNILLDTVRGDNKCLFSDLTNAELNDPSFAGGVFSGNDLVLPSKQNVNSNGNTFVGWAWDAGTSTVSNTDGSITSQVRANPSAGFSIVNWVRNGGSNTATIGHGLNAAPQLIILKDRDSSSNWYVGSPFIDTSRNDFLPYLSLNRSDGRLNNSDVFTQGGSVTNTTFGVGAVGNPNGNNLAYCFTPVESYSAIGSYTGNNSATDGPFIYTGFRVAWLMVKKTNASGTDWLIEDSTRSSDNPTQERLRANAADAESSNTGYDFLSNGFKLRDNSTAFNNNGDTYLYIAFAEHPFKTARAR